MREVNRYKAEVTKIGGKKENYLGPTIEAVCEFCDNLPGMESYVVKNRTTNWVVARYTKVNCYDKKPVGLRELYTKDEQRRQLQAPEMKEVAITSC